MFGLLHMEAPEAPVVSIVEMAVPVDPGGLPGMLQQPTVFLPEPPLVFTREVQDRMDRPTYQERVEEQEVLQHTDRIVAVAEEMPDHRELPVVVEVEVQPLL